MATALRTIVAVMMASLVAVCAHSEVGEVPEDRSGRIYWAFNMLSIDTMDELEKFYSDDIHFIDPLVDIEGLDAVVAHYERQYGAVREIAFEFTNEIIAGDTHVVEWEMTLRTKRLNKGKAFVVPGSSIIQFDDEDKVIMHRDYFDVGAMVYDRLPVIRFFTKKIKKRLTPHPVVTTTEEPKPAVARNVAKATLLPQDPSPDDMEHLEMMENGHSN